MNNLTRAVDTFIEAVVHIVILVCAATLWVHFYILPLVVDQKEKQAALNQDAIVSNTTSSGFDDSTPCFIDPWHPTRSPCSPVYWAKDLEDDVSR